MTGKLGFGLMRLPKDGDGRIMLDKTCEMVDAFMAAGFTYFDTAYVYEGSEEIAGKAIVSRYPRDRYTMASKMNAARISDTLSPYGMFREQLERTGLEYFDYYLLHSLQDGSAEEAEAKGCWEAVNRLKAEGRIRHLGFSFHGGPELLEDILTRHPETEFVQLQINYLDWESPIIRARENYEVARRHGLPVVIMEPVKGGMLASIGHGILEEGTAPSLALRFAAGLDGVLAVLSGMSTLEQVEDNIRTFSDMRSLTDDERARLEKVVKALRSEGMIECTSCRYCTRGCPKGIAIPDIFNAINDLRAFGEHNRPRFFYRDMLASGKTARASECIACGRCSRTCPQHLDIPRLLKEASAVLDD